MSRMQPVAGGGAGGRGSVGMLGRGIAAVGVARAIVGFGAWVTVRRQLAEERIVVPESAGRFGGRRVAGPITAFAEADAIKQITLRATGGRTYGELDEHDPLARMAMDAALLRSSLFTSVLAFGVAAAEIALGATLIAVGAALAGGSSGTGARAG